MRYLLTITKLSALIEDNERIKNIFISLAIRRYANCKHARNSALGAVRTLSPFQFLLVSDDLSMYNINALQPEIDKTTSSFSACSPNVCEHHILKGVYRKCQKVPGKRRLQCRSVTSTSRYKVVYMKCTACFIKK